MAQIESGSSHSVFGKHLVVARKAGENQHSGRRPPAERMNVRVVLFFLACRRRWWLD
jgi:hypothetical protein